MALDLYAQTLCNQRPRLKPSATSIQSLWIFNFNEVEWGTQWSYRYTLSSSTKLFTKISKSSSRKRRSRWINSWSHSFLKRCESWTNVWKSRVKYQFKIPNLFLIHAWEANSTFLSFSHLLEIGRKTKLPLMKTQMNHTSSFCFSPSRNNTKDKRAPNKKSHVSMPNNCRNTNPSNQFQWNSISFTSMEVGCGCGQLIKLSY